MSHPERNWARIREDYYCRDCGWPIVDACCNPPFTNFKDASEWDWWLYCSNKGCKNHDGEGVFQNWPNWVVRIEKERAQSKPISK